MDSDGGKRVVLDWLSKKQLQPDEPREQIMHTPSEIAQANAESKDCGDGVSLKNCQPLNLVGKKILLWSWKIGGTCQQSIVSKQGGFKLRRSSW